MGPRRPGPRPGPRVSRNVNERCVHPPVRYNEARLVALRACADDGKQSAAMVAARGAPVFDDPLDLLLSFAPFIGLGLIIVLALAYLIRVVLQPAAGWQVTSPRD